MSIGLAAAALALTLTLPPLIPSAAPKTPVKPTDPAQYYPSRAARSGVEGEAKIHCIVNPDGRLIGCVVLSETPESYGFGTASVAVAERLFQTRPPASTSGADEAIDTTINWRLPANAKRAGTHPAASK